MSVLHFLYTKPVPILQKRVNFYLIYKPLNYNKIKNLALDLF